MDRRGTNWLGALAHTARSGLRIERTRLEPLVALRAAAGVAVVIGLALWLATPAYAASSAFGAFASGIATFQRSWRPRPVLALAAAAGLAVSSFLGYLAAGHLAAFVVLLAVWSFGAGMAWTAGPASGTVASFTVAVMLVVVTLPTSTVGALQHAGVIAFGGFIQAALIVAFPVRRWGAQRDALAEAFATVADYARRLRYDPLAPFDPESLMTARSASAVTPRQAQRRPPELHGQRAFAERIRPVLASLADPAVGAAAEGPERDRARELLGTAAAILDAVARAIRSGAPVRLPPGTVQTLDVPAGGSPLAGPARRAAGRLAALLTAAVDSAEAGEVPEQAGQQVLLRPTLPQLVPLAIRAVRCELRWDSSVLRHAVRLAVVASAGYLLASALPLGHRYWAPLTSVMVLRPDFSETYARGWARFAGTVAGVLVASGVMQLTERNMYACAGLAVGSVGLMYLLLRTGYAVTSACIAAYVVFLLGMSGVAWTTTVPDRLLLTLLGGTLAMGAYAVFPTWETPRLRERLADWLEANGRYASAVASCFAEPTARGHQQVRQALLNARSARLAWEQAVARARAEPVRHRGLGRRATERAQDALASMGRGTMVMEAHLPGRDVPAVPEAAGLAAALRAATVSGAGAVREGRVPQWSGLPEAMAALEARRGESHAYDVLLRGTELFAESLGDLAHAVGPPHFGPPA